MYYSAIHHTVFHSVTTFNYLAALIKLIENVCRYSTTVRNESLSLLIGPVNLRQ